VKKLIIICVLVAVLVGGLVGGTVLAGKPPATGVGVLMDSARGTVTLATPLDVSYASVRHVSLTVLFDTFYPDSWIDFGVYYSDSWAMTEQFNPSSIDYTRTFEFDTTHWKITAYGDPDCTAYYSYTVTWPNK